MIQQIAALALLTATAVVPSGLEAAGRSRIDAVFKQYNSNTPGCALGVFRNGSIAYARGYGMADLERHVRITPASLFDVGSVSKQFSAAAIALLVQEGKVRFGDDVRKYIPELPSYGVPVTLDNLMWHTSGLRDYTDLLDLAGYSLQGVTTDDQTTAIIARQRALDVATGTQFEYSNTNYFLLSVIVKRVTGMTLAQFVRKNILGPLEMSHTMYRTDYAMLVPNRAMGYGPAPDGGFQNSMSNWQQTGDGGVQLSIDDAARWDENFYHPRVGGDAMIAALQTPGQLANGTRLDYGRGLFIGTYRGLRLIYHGGAWIGYRAEFDRFPSVHTSVVVLCNSDAAHPQILAQRVEDVVLGPYLASVPAHTVRSSSIAPSRLAGAYIDAAAGSILHVRANGSALVLDAGGPPLTLQPAGGTTFTAGRATVRFSAATSGDAAMLQIAQGAETPETFTRFTPVRSSAAQLRGAGGWYSSPELGTRWHLHASADKLVLDPSRLLPDGIAGTLEPQNRDTFSCDAGGFLIQLRRDPKDTITGFTLHAGKGLRALNFTRDP